MTVFRPIAGGGNGDCRRARHESVRRPALQSDRAAAGGRQDSGRGRRAMSARGETPEDMITRTGTITPTTMSRGRIRCPTVAPAGTVVDTTRRIIRYGFVELLDDVSWWLVLGIVLSAVAVVAIPAQLFDGMWGGGIASMVLMLVLSIPLYTCASCSTPMAAALALKGLSPGAVLVFLLRRAGHEHRQPRRAAEGPGPPRSGCLSGRGRHHDARCGFRPQCNLPRLGLDPRATFGTAAGFVPDLVQGSWPPCCSPAY